MPKTQITLYCRLKHSVTAQKYSYPVRAVQGCTKQSLLPIFGAESLKAVLMSGTDKQLWEEKNTHDNRQKQHEGKAWHSNSFLVCQILSIFLFAVFNKSKWTKTKKKNQRSLKPNIIRLLFCIKKGHEPSDPEEKKIDFCCYNIAAISM